jgi:peroxiredoxin
VAALDPGALFPSIALRDETGAEVSRPAADTVYAVFKTTCPTCELTWPFLDRIRRIGGLNVIAVSQDDAAKTAAFAARVGTRIETAFDPEPWKASDRLGVTTVPTLFRVGASGAIEETVIGFDRARMEGLARRAATLAGRPYEGLLSEGEQVPAIKPG